MSAKHLLPRNERVTNKNVFIMDLSLSYKSYSLGPHITTNLSEAVLLKGKSNAFVNNENYINTLRTGDTDLRFHITTVQDG